MSPSQKTLHYQIIGKDSPSKLVFLHGIMGQGRNWQSIAKKFSSHHQCLIFDQRGHGQSFKPPSGFALTDYVEDLKNLLLELGWSSPVKLVGHSMGGRVALSFAHRYPQWVEKLVIVDIGPSSDWSSMESILAKLYFVPVPFQSRQQARSFMENQFLTRFKNPMVMEFFYSNLTEQEGQFSWVFDPKAIQQTLENSRYKDYWAEFKSLSMPTLLLRGDRSEDLKPDDFVQVLKNNNHIEGIVIPGAGHWVHAEKPLETIAAIEGFFRIAETPEQ